MAAENIADNIMSLWLTTVVNTNVELHIIHNALTRKL